MSYKGSLLSSASLAVAGRRALGFSFFPPFSHSYASARLAILPNFFAIFDFNNNIFRRSFMPVFAKRFCFTFLGAGQSAKEKANVILLKRCGQNAFWLPSKPMASQYGAVANSAFFGPLHQTQGNPFMSHINVPRGIVGLFLSSRPATIFRAVRAVIINAFKAVLFGRVPHVSQKGIKVFPGWANFYPPAAITVIMSRFRVVTSGLHLGPNAVNSRIGQSVSFGHEAVITYCKELSNEL